MMINLLSGTMVINNGRLKKRKLKKSSCGSLGNHQDGGIGAFLKTKKEKQKNCGNKHETFLYLMTEYKKFGSCPTSKA